MHPLIRRERAVTACLSRFDGKAYAPGRRDCVRLAAHALRRQGHATPALKGLTWKTEAEAYRLLRKLGHADLPAAVDATGLPRIAPAATLPGDLIAIPSADDCGLGGALMVVVEAGAGRVFGFSGGVAAVFRPVEFVCAWRV